MAVKGWELIGRAVKDYFYGDKQATIITQSDCAGSETMPAAVFFRTARHLSDLERYALSLCRGNTLDLGAGAGCHSLILQKKGLPVTALDISPDAVFVMGERGVRDAISVDFRDFLDHSDQRFFDTVLMLMNGIGIVGDLNGLEQFFRNIPRVLNPGGQLLFDSADLRLIEGGDGSGRPVGKGTADYYGMVNYALEYRGLRSDPFTWLYLDQRTLRKLAAAAGWQCQIIFEEGCQYLARLVRQ